MQNAADDCTLTPLQIVMHIAEYCSDCLRVNESFEANRIPYLCIGFEGNSAATDFVKQVDNGYQSVPTFICPDGSAMGEPNWQEPRARLGNS